MGVFTAGARQIAALWVGSGRYKFSHPRGNHMNIQALLRSFVNLCSKGKVRGKPRQP